MTYIDSSIHQWVKSKNASDGQHVLPTGTITVTEQGQPGQDIYHQCAARECDDGRLEIIRPGDDALMASYAPGVWSVRFDDGRTVVPVDDEGEDDPDGE